VNAVLLRGRRHVILDLHDDADRRRAADLAASADVVVENFRPGRLAEWGLDYDSLRANNPGVVLVHVSGFGQTGPRADEAGFGSIGEAVGGIRHTTGDPDRPPARAGISLGDSLAALFAVIGTLAALHERHRSGLGQEVDVAIYEAVAALMESTMADYEVAGVVRGRSGGTLPGVAPANAYPTADGSEVLIAGNADGVFARLCAALDCPELADDPRYAGHHARGRHAAELDAELAARTVAHDAEDLLRLLRDAGVPAGRVYTAPDMVQDPHFLARDMVLRATARAGFELPMTGIVPRFSRTPGAVADVGPALGEHTVEVEAELRNADPRADQPRSGSER
jgi:crotonobetainyl-CoA:carnitine CoA-transferase CaiB-like acyl-CoA transferase